VSGVVVDCGGAMAESPYRHSCLARKERSGPSRDFARQNGVTQIFVTRPRSRTWLRFRLHDPVQEIIDLGKDMQIVIVSERDPLLRGSVKEWG
jgi:K+-sensing histidine kinase KdpD